MLITLIPELLITIALNLPKENITTFCQVCHTFNNLICTNNFWYLKINNDYWNITDNNVCNWKFLYKYYFNLFVCGYNYAGQLGFDDFSMRTDLALVPHIKPRFVTCSKNSSFVIDMNDIAWACGDNSYGRLGLGSTAYLNKFTMIPNIRAKYIATDIFSTLLIDINNNVWTCGTNYTKQLGAIKFFHCPVIRTFVSLDKKARYVTCSNNNFALIDLNGCIFVWGSFTNIDRFTNMTMIMPQIRAKQVVFSSNDSLVVLTVDGHVIINQMIIYNLNYYTTLRLSIKVKKLACSKTFLYFIDINDNVWCYFDMRIIKTYEKTRSVEATYTDLLTTETLIPINIKAKIISCLNSYDKVGLIDIDNNVWIAEDVVHTQVQKIYDSTFTKLPNIKASNIAISQHTLIIGVQNP